MRAIVLATLILAAGMAGCAFPDEQPPSGPELEVVRYDIDRYGTCTFVYTVSEDPYAGRTMALVGCQR